MALISSKKPITQLFLMTSIDGKISTGVGPGLDFDQDFPNIPGVSEGLDQYYKLEMETDLWSLNSGAVKEKMGVNEKPLPDKTPVNFVLIDSKHLTKHGVEWFCHKSNKFVLITSNRNHPAYMVDADNMEIILQQPLNLKVAFAKLYQMGCDKLTIQTGGELNGLLLREKLINYVNIVIAPVMIGGRNTPTLIDGEPLTNTGELSKVGALQLESVTKLRNSYLNLRYKVIS